MDAPRRIVVAGEMPDGATAPALAQGFREAGWLVARVDLQRYQPAGSGIAGKVISRLSGPAVRRAYNRAIAEAARTADAVLVVKGSLVMPDTITMLRQGGVLAVLYYPDVEFDHPGMDPGILDAFDMVVTSKTFHLPTLEERLGKERVQFLHHGFDPLIHRRRTPSPGQAYRRDLVFIGNFSAYKLHYLSALADAGIDSFAILGGGWEGARGTALERFVTHQAPMGDDYVQELAQSRIAIALHHGPVRTPGWEDQVSTRSFEIPASGAMMLHIDNPEIATLYDVGREVATFTDGSELVAKVYHYLSDENNRLALAEAGHKRATREHSYWARARSLSELIKTRLDT